MEKRSRLSAADPGLNPQGIEIPFKEHNGLVELQLEKLVCHQMIVLHY